MNKKIKNYISKIILIFLVFNYATKLLEKTKLRLKLNKQINIPKVSVFLPIYNKHHYLHRSIGSIQNQTLKDIEIIAVNDASTDMTLQELKKLSKKDHRIKIINNDRNHGLLYSRTMGILNCSGEYIMNLDPDDRLEGNDNLEVLYNTSKISNVDYLRFLIKSIPLNRNGALHANDLNLHQFKMKDYFITNKFIKKETIIKAYENFKNKIFFNKWNFHEDNIWNSLIRRYSNISKDFNKFIYIYKINNQSLVVNKNSLEIKNKIYLIQTLLELNIRYYNIYKLFKVTIISCSNQLLSDIEIKNKLIHICINLINRYNNNKYIINDIKYFINEISYNKIIIFNNNKNNLFEKCLIQSSIYKYLTEKYNKTVISINFNNKKQIKNILNYIFPSDILVGYDDLIFNPTFTSIINRYSNNKIIIFFQNINESKINSIINLISIPNIIIYSFNYNIYEKLTKIIKNEKLFIYPNFILQLANYFNYKNSLINNNNVLILLEKNLHYLNEEYIKNITLKYYEKINYLNSLDKNKLNNLISIIQSNQLILTDNLYLMELSAIYFISCIFFKDDTKNENNIDLIL